MLLQFDTRFSWYSRWGCFNHVDYMAAQDITMGCMSVVSLEEAIEEGMSRPAPFRGDKRTLDTGPDGKSWWNYDPDWWAQKMFDLCNPGAYEVFQVGQIRDGEIDWYSDKPWWPRRKVYAWTYIKDYWKRPNGGHYTYYNVKNNRSLNPDPTLELEWASGGRLMYVRRAVR